MAEVISPVYDYNHSVDVEYQKWRKLAQDASHEREKLSKQSQEAYKRGDKVRAHELSVQSHAKFAEYAEYNLKAAEYVFWTNNQDSAADEIDLHGLHVNESIWILKKRVVNEYTNNDLRPLKAIVGKGLHSAHGVAKLKPAVEELCSEAGISCQVQKGNSGVLVLGFASGWQPPAQWIADTQQPTSAYGRTGQQQQQQQQQQQYGGHVTPTYDQNATGRHGNSSPGLWAALLSLMCVCLGR